jgi:ABC-2 type transport system permease protein
MWMICKKEWNQFFSSLTGYVALIVFLLLNGLIFFVFPDTSLLDFGYASLDGFFFPRRHGFCCFLFQPLL